MARVGVRPPAPAAIAEAPREYAILSGLEGFSSGNVDSEALKKVISQYSANGAAELNGVVELLGEDTFDFKTLAAALKLPQVGPTVEGNVLGWAVQQSKGNFAPWRFDRRPVGEKDVVLTITYAGICHSDLHQVDEDWGPSQFPMVPGHEIVGIVTEVGSGVTKLKVGDVGGVGCIIKSCGSCEGCHDGEEMFCPKQVLTYNHFDWSQNNSVTQGGYSTYIVVDENFVVKVPENLSQAAAAPLLCAGITTYSPLRQYGLDKPGMKLGVVGLGGLGHMAVKLGKAMGLEVTVLSTSPNKEKEAISMLGADHFVVTKDPKQMEALEGTLDGILDTVSAQHDIMAEVGLLKAKGTLVLLGAPPTAYSLAPFPLILGRKKIGGSPIGGIRETQEMLDFCGKHNITCEVEVITADYLDTAYERLKKNDVRYRFSIDIAKSLAKMQPQ